MAEDKHYSNQEIVEVMLDEIIEDIYKEAEHFAALLGKNEFTGDLKEELGQLQLRTLISLFTYIDGSVGPSDWSGIKLVHPVTSEELSPILTYCTLIAQAEYRFHMRPDGTEYIGDDE